MKVIERNLPFLVFLAVAAASVALYLTAWRLSSGQPIPAIEAKLWWSWDNVTVHISHNRWLDPLWVALWAIVPVSLYLDRRESEMVRHAPLYGLVAAGGIFLVFWGEPGVAFWPLMAPIAMVTGRVLHLVGGATVERAEAAQQQPFRFLHALAFVNGFGFGLLLPHAMRYGFRWAAYVLCAYILLGLLTCAVAFGTLGALRFAARTFRKIFLEPTRKRTRGELGASGTPEERETNPDFRPEEPPKEVAEQTVSAPREPSRDSTREKND